MGKRDNDRKSIKRLQLRREIIRVLADDSLTRVGGGMVCTGSGGDVPTEHCSPCVPSK
jgi:hypothetical protein